MATTLDLGSFSDSEKQALLSAAKAEVLVRLGGGRVVSGGGSGSNYSVATFSADELNRLINALTAELGLQSVETRVQPTFTQWRN